METDLQRSRGISAGAAGRRGAGCACGAYGPALCPGAELGDSLGLKGESALRSGCS